MSKEKKTAYFGVRLVPSTVTALREVYREIQHEFEKIGVKVDWDFVINLLIKCFRLVGREVIREEKSKFSKRETISDVYI